MAIWDRFLTEQDREVFSKGGYGKRGSWGQRPALMVIDIQYNFIGDRPEPILQSMERWRHSCGELGWKAVPVVADLLRAARAVSAPVIYTGSKYEPNDIQPGNRTDKNARAAESTRLHEAGTLGTRIVEQLAPSESDVVIWKKRASAFFGTPLITHLIAKQVDTLIFTGCTTSGCVRASVVEAASIGFKVVVAEDAVFDRGEASHAMSLFDMQSKYADVLPAAEVIAYLNRLPSAAGGM